MSIFGIVILVLVGAIAFYHYTQGFFSASFSAIISILAAAVALGYQESLVSSLLQGKFADDANAIALVVLYAVTYFGLRVLFDSFVPGNIRLPVLVDKIGAGAMGVVAGIFGAGIVAIAAQTMPFGPSIAGYSRYVIGDERQVVIPPGEGHQRSLDTQVSEELKSDTFMPNDSKSMILPADDMVIGMVSYMSNDGSLAGDASFADVHPNYLDELFGDRLGIQIGAKHTAMNTASRHEVSVPANGVFALDGVTQTEGEIKELRTATVKKGKLAPSSSQILLVVRALFSRNATDSDGIFRFSTASCRLVANGKNFFPIGTLSDKGNLLFANRMDDFLFAEVPSDDHGADLVFLLDKKDVLASGTADPKGDKPMELLPGTFLEVKRLARVDLSGRKVEKPIKPGGEKVALLRKPDVLLSSGTAQATNAPISYDSISVSSKLFSPINVGKPDPDGNEITLRAGTVSFKERKLTKAVISATDSLAQLGPKTGYNIDTLAPPAGKALVEVKGRVPAKSESDPWSWVDQLSELELLDESGNRYKPCGAFAMTIKSKGAKAMVGAYDSSGALPTVTHSSDDGRPQDVYLYYAVPSGAHVTQFVYQSKQVATFPAVVVP